MATDVASFTDEDLREKLIGYGVNVGPIVSSTRQFYEKKLSKLINSGGVLHQQPETEESEEEEEEEEEDEEVQFKHKQPQHTSTPITQTQNYTPITQARLATPTTATRRNVSGQPNSRQTTTSKQRKSEAAGKKRGISIWIKLIFVLIVSFLIYLVIINMNPSAVNKIPLIFQDQN